MWLFHLRARDVIGILVAVLLPQPVFAQCGDSSARRPPEPILFSHLVASDGDTGFNGVPYATLLAPGSVTITGFRINRDREPGDIDIADIGLSVGWNVHQFVDVFSSWVPRRRVDVDAVDELPTSFDLPYLVADAADSRWIEGRGDGLVGAKFLLARGCFGTLSARGSFQFPLSTVDETRQPKQVLGQFLWSRRFARRTYLHGGGGFAQSWHPLEHVQALTWGGGVDIAIGRAIVVRASARGVFAVQGTDRWNADTTDAAAGVVLRFRRVIISPFFTKRLSESVRPVPSRTGLNITASLQMDLDR